MATETVARRFQMIRVASGDYLLPANDGETMWRLCRYAEDDGTLSTADGKVISGTFWMVLRWTRPIGYGTDILEASGWREEASLLRTRQAAIDYALSS